MASIRQLVLRGGDTATWSASTKVPLEYEPIVRKKNDGSYELCIGNGVALGKNLSPISGGGSGGGLPTIDPLTVLANVDPDNANTAAQVLLLPDEEDSTIPNLLDAMGVIGSSGRTELEQRIGDLSDDEIDNGGVRGILDRFIGLRVPAPLNVSGTTTNGSSTVTVTTALPADVLVYDRVSASAGIPANSYIGTIAVDRLSFTLTSDIFSFGTPTPVNATATGSRTVTIRRISPSVFGHYLAGILSQNVYTGAYSLRSTPNALGTNAITGDTTELRVKDGVVSIRAAQVQGGIWEQINDQADLVLQNRQVVASIGPATHHVWTNLPAAGTAGADFLNETSPNLRHRFSLLIPDSNYTQFMLGIDRLIVQGTSTSTMWAEWLDPSDNTWKDLTTTRVTVSLNNPVDTYKESIFGTLTSAAKAAAGVSPSRSIYCRLRGTTTGAATGSPEFTSVWTIVK